ncbi:MFS transporter [Pseudarthrobacter sulfonivorans]|uniref:MFS transporter n=1 Tax=Pseudarthrobacter sulfonivorans TaxID=121292 RepID=UPI0021036474|nr:MFS transporter [Pseudarthrobacter sulfonivorans]
MSQGVQSAGTEPATLKPKNRMAKRAALSALFGSTVEYFDFTLFATASALIFGQVFFAPLGTTGALLASFATFGVAYVARPAGALLFGSLGDRIGRKRTLMITLNLMGAATFLVGLLPGYATIGIAAPIILVILRLLQGLSAGGEQAGSNSLSLEHAPEGKRGLYTSWTMQGTALGTLLASVVFIMISSMEQSALMSWGWRIPFLLSGPLMLISLYIRKGVDETDAFLETKEARNEAKVPVFEVFRDHWRSVLRVVGCSFLAVGGSTLSVFLLGYAVGTVKIPASQMLIASVVAGVVGLVAQPLWASLSDRVGRRPVFTGTMIAAAILWFPTFGIVSTGNFGLIVMILCVFSVVASGANAVGASMYTEMFPTKVRYTGVAIGTQLGFLVAGFAPAIEQAIQGQGPGGWLPIAIFASACMLVAAVAGWSGKETKGMNLRKIDEVAV